MTKIFDTTEIESLERFYRVSLINKISGYKSGNLIGTKSKDGASNLAIFNSVIHVGANPPYLGFLLRPNTVERHTYNNIKETGFFTINQINSNIHKKAHKTSASFPREISEFDACELQEVYLDGFPSPFVGESLIKIGLSFVEENLIKSNKTILIIGKIEKLILPKECISKDGDVDLEKLDTVAIGGLDTYYRAEKLGRYAYSRPNEDVNEID